MSKNLSDLWNESVQSATWEHIREYHLNHAYLEGRQWLSWTPVDRSLSDIIPDEPDRIQATVNHMRSNTRTIVSQLTQRQLTFEVPPSMYDDVTLRAAAISKGILSDLHRRHNWETLREENIKSCLKGGTSIVAVEWSPQNKTTKETVLSIADFVVEPGATRMEYARWWIKLQQLPPNEVRSLFPDHFIDEAPEADARTHWSNDYTSEPTDLTRVYTYYERPNPLNPDGGFRVEVNGRTLQEGKWPFPWKDSLNIASIRESVIENSPYGTTIMSDVRSPQTALNAVWSAVLEHIRESSNHRLVADYSWADVVDSLTDRPGEPLIGPMEAGAPGYLTAPPMPTQFAQTIAMLKEEIDNLLGVHDVSRGMSPANIESGYGLAILAEKDSSPVGRLIKESANLWGRVGWMVLELHEDNVTEERESTIRDMGGAPARRKWKGEDIKGQTEAIVPLEAIVPKSQAAQQQFAMTAVEMGLITPDDPLAVSKFAQLAEMPDQRGIIAAVSPDADKAIRENEMVVMDEVPEPKPFDDHEIHIEMHNRFRKSLQYELLTDEQREDIDNHVLSHEALVGEEMGERRMATEMDPAMGAAPMASGAAPMEALPEEAYGETAPPGGEEALIAELMNQFP